MKEIVIVLGFFVFMTSAVLSHGENVSRDKWISGMQKDLKKSMCSKTSFFRKCFQVSQKQCNDVAERVIARCVKELEGQIPVVIKDKNTGNWGQKLGRCAGGAYEKELSSNAIQSDKCNTVPYWIE